LGQTVRFRGTLVKADAFMKNLFLDGGRLIEGSGP